ncbi:hypothetical protein H3C70_04025 [Patescibacteria group bacterium]|nr:hypothetical protein [Patescibacteria group bacterium]
MSSEAGIMLYHDPSGQLYLHLPLTLIVAVFLLLYIVLVLRLLLSRTQTIDSSPAEQDTPPSPTGFSQVRHLEL